MENILIKKREQVFAQIRQLRIQRDAITRAIASIERYRKSPTEGVTSLEYIDQRRIYAIPASQNFYTGTIEDFEAVLTELKNNMIAGGLPQAYYYNVGTTMTREDFQARRFVASEVFAFVDSHFPPLPEIRTLESGMYACIYLSHYDDEIPYAEKLLQFCQSNGYRISGDYICEVMTEFNVFDEAQRSMYLRLQVPISFEEKP